MKKSEMRRILCDSLRSAGVPVDDRMEKAIKDGLLEIRRQEFRNRIERQRKARGLT